jgi:hypothetical protein
MAIVVFATARRRNSGVPVVLFSAPGSAPAVSGLRQVRWGVVVGFVPRSAHFTLWPVPGGMRKREMRLKTYGNVCLCGFRVTENQAE